ncbi:hypothetical protein Y032_0130g1519 [Ancylostoma ceylanicum]|nr:hypothetical protein Y032_0130g1519 [Ancylostoma ceylanicum]
MESFDVSSFYTNVSTNDALQALHEMLTLHEKEIEMYGLSRTLVMTLIRGLAMGQRLAPVLAIRFMSKIEEPVFARLPLLYCRYIDDCIVITSTQSEMDECFRIFNEQSQYTTLSREIHLDDWLPSLNTQLELCKGMVHVKWYRKESSNEGRILGGPSQS